MSAPTSYEGKKKFCNRYKIFYDKLSRIQKTVTQKIVVHGKTESNKEKVEEVLQAIMNNLFVVKSNEDEYSLTGTNEHDLFPDIKTMGKFGTVKASTLQVKNECFGRAGMFLKGNFVKNC